MHLNEEQIAKILKVHDQIEHIFVEEEFMSHEVASLLSCIIQYFDEPTLAYFNALVQQEIKNRNTPKI